jgi:hypothetical protein
MLQAVSPYDTVTVPTVVAGGGGVKVTNFSDALREQNKRAIAAAVIPPPMQTRDSRITEVKMLQIVKTAAKMHEEQVQPEMTSGEIDRLELSLWDRMCLSTPGGCLKKRWLSTDAKEKLDRFHSEKVAKELDAVMGELNREIMVLNNEVSELGVGINTLSHQVKRMSEGDKGPFQNQMEMMVLRQEMALEAIARKQKCVLACIQEKNDYAPLEERLLAVKNKYRKAMKGISLDDVIDEKEEVMEEIAEIAGAKKDFKRKMERTNRRDNSEMEAKVKKRVAALLGGGNNVQMQLVYPGTNPMRGAKVAPRGPVHQHHHHHEDNDDDDDEGGGDPDGQEDQNMRLLPIPPQSKVAIQATKEVAMKVSNELG